jgi:hypothetical protein
MAGRTEYVESLLAPIEIPPGDGKRKGIDILTVDLAGIPRAINP